MPVPLSGSGTAVRCERSAGAKPHMAGRSRAMRTRGNDRVCPRRIRVSLVLVVACLAGAAFMWMSRAHTVRLDEQVALTEGLQVVKTALLEKLAQTEKDRDALRKQAPFSPTPRTPRNLPPCALAG